MQADKVLLDVHLYRDRFGVPHAFAESLQGAYFGLGYCAAQDRPRTLPLHQLMLQGRLAERLGDRKLPDPDFPLLDSLNETPFFRGYAQNAMPLDSLAGVDRWMRNFGYYEAARRELDQLSDRSRTIVEAFAAGVNHFFRSQERVGEIDDYDPATELGWWSCFEHTIAMGFFISNAFAIAPARTESGAVWIAGDPHYWFLDGHSEAHIVCPELDLSGIWDGHVNLGMWGGTNCDIAVHITAAGLEGAAVYCERVNPQNREEYFDWRAAGYRPFEATSHVIQVAGGEPILFVARRTHHGPVVGEALVDGAPVAYTIRSPFVADSGRRLDQHLEIWTKRSVDEFIAHVRDAEFVRGHRVCGDRHGNIGYVCNGPVAVRSVAFDWGKPVDGSVPETEWADKLWRPDAPEHGLPSFTNPPCGFIQSANDPPWVTTVPASTGTDFPKYVFPDGWRELGTRGARQRQVLSDSGMLTRAEAVGLLLDVFVPKAYHGIRVLRERFAKERGQLPQLSGAAVRLDQLLAAWDGRAERDSAAMTAAFYLNRALSGGLPEPVVRVTGDPRTECEIAQPDDVAITPRAYARALEEVAETLETTYGTIEKPWGDVHAIPRPNGDLGVPGGCNALRALFGTWRGWWDVDDVIDPDGVERCNFGTRTLRFTELGRNSVSVHSVAITGQVPANEHAKSPHALDQSERYARLELKRLPLSRAEVEADARTEDHAACSHDAVTRIRMNA